MHESNLFTLDALLVLIITFHSQVRYFLFFFFFKDVSEECNVSCMPTFQFYKNENKVSNEEWPAQILFKYLFYSYLMNHFFKEIKVYDMCRLSIF